MTYWIKVAVTEGNIIHTEEFCAGTASTAKKALKDKLVEKNLCTAKRANEKVRNYDASYIKRNGLKIWGPNYTAEIKIF